MIRNTLGLPARSLMVAAAAACWLPFAAAPDALHGQSNNTVPSAPQNLMASVGGSTAIDLDWEVPASNGGSPITGYLIERSANRSTWDIIERNTGLTLSYRDSNRNPGTTRYYRVAAVNAVGTSGYSNVVEGTTPGSTGTAGAPRNLTADAAGPTIINLNWDVPSSTGGKTISGYQVRVSTNGGVNFTAPGDYDHDHAPAHGSHGGRHPPLRGQGAVLRQHPRARGVRERHHAGDRDTGRTPEPDGDGLWPVGHRPRLGCAGLGRWECNHRLRG